MSPRIQKNFSQNGGTINAFFQQILKPKKEVFNEIWNHVRDGTDGSRGTRLSWAPMGGEGFAPGWRHYNDGGATYASRGQACRATIATTNGTRNSLAKPNDPGTNAPAHGPAGPLRAIITGNPAITATIGESACELRRLGRDSDHANLRSLDAGSIKFPKPRQKLELKKENLNVRRHY